MVAIDREGFVYAYDDIHDRARSYGNLLTASFAELHAGDVRARVVAGTRARVSEVSCRLPACRLYVQHLSGGRRSRRGVGDG